MSETAGEWLQEDVPAGGWQGFLNIFRRLLRRPIVTERLWVYKTEPIEIPPGGEITITVPLDN